MGSGDGGLEKGALCVSPSILVEIGGLLLSVSSKPTFPLLLSYFRCCFEEAAESP